MLTLTNMAFLDVTSDMTAGDLVVGLGTLALAGFTAWLARRTSAEVAVPPWSKTYPPNT